MSETEETDATDGGIDLGDLARRVEADEFRDLGRQRQAQGDNEDAAAYYQMAADVYPTAETLTLLATTLAARGSWQEAADLTGQALEMDPELGNAHNDRGVYLEQLGRVPEAMEAWQRAIDAPRNDSRHFPHYHRGRIFEQRGQFTAARDAFARALEFEPDWGPARTAYLRALGWLN